MNEVSLGDLNFLNSFAVLTLAGIPETDESFPAEELNLSILLSFLLLCEILVEAETSQRQIISTCTKKMNK